MGALWIGMRHLFHTPQEESWDLCWSDLSVSVERVSKLRPYQRLNHFPSMLEICRKAALSKVREAVHRCPPLPY